MNALLNVQLLAEGLRSVPQWAITHADEHDVIPPRCKLGKSFNQALNPF
jgi:hypothetical protein